MLHHHYPTLFGDLPMDACGNYETRFFDHRRRFFAARRVPTVPCETRCRGRPGAS